MGEIDKSKTEPWLAVDPNATHDVTVPEGDPAGLSVTLKYWPPMVEMRLRPRLAGLSIYQEGASGLNPAKPEDAERMVSLNENDLTLYREAVKYGVAGWKGEPAAVTEVEEIDGEKVKVLSRESINRLFHNRLLFAVAQNAIAFNVLTEKKSERSAP